MGLLQLLILILVAITSTFGKYVFYNTASTWLDAQNYCQGHHTDLATISNQGDMDFAQQVMGGYSKRVWIGLKRNSTEKWVWSGGGEVVTLFWQPPQPDILNQEYGALMNSKWFDEYGTDKYAFLCSSVNVVRQEKTWEQAMDYCKNDGTKLASVTSKAELLLIQKELSKNDITDRVWTGLHFLVGKWMWINGQAMTYELWGPYGKPWCPGEDFQCGALVTSELRAMSGRTQPDQLYIKQWVVDNCNLKFQFICQ